MATKPKSQPRYQALADYYRTKILSGELPPGTKLPSITQLLAKHRIGYSTLFYGLILLKTEGLIYGRQGIGMFVAGDDQ